MVDEVDRRLWKVPATLGVLIGLFLVIAAVVVLLMWAL
jgi:hypothetical protein